MNLGNNKSLSDYYEQLTRGNGVYSHVHRISQNQILDENISNIADSKINRSSPTDVSVRTDRSSPTDSDISGPTVGPSPTSSDGSGRTVGPSPTSSDGSGKTDVSEMGKKYLHLNFRQH